MHAVSITSLDRQALLQGGQGNSGSNFPLPPVQNDLPPFVSKVKLWQMVLWSDLDCITTLLSQHLLGSQA